MLQILIYVALFSLVGVLFTNAEKACADFNYGSSAGAMAGLENAFICPFDGLSQVVCREKYPLKSSKDIKPEHVSLVDVLFYILVGPKSKTDAFKWWLPLLKEPVDILLIADACPDGKEECDDGVSELLRDLRTATVSEKLDTGSGSGSIHPPKFHITRVNPWDRGYDVLSCKTRTGQRHGLELFPDKKYYFKFDTDTLIFPGRLQHFLSTLHAVHIGSSNAYKDIPIYFGAVQESGGSLLLCGNLPLTEHSGDTSKGGLCYGQGGAGYGLNKEGMRIASSVPLCTEEGNNNKETRDLTPEDTQTALSLYNYGNKTNIIHCGGFDSSELVNDRKMKNSITFHYIDKSWLQKHGHILLKHYHNPHNARGG